MLNKYLSTLTLLAFAGLGGYASAGVINGSFETGDLTGYDYVGNVNVVTSSTSYAGNDYYATDGNYFVEINTDSDFYDDCSVLSPDATNCSAIGTSASLYGGQTLNFDWAFLTEDYDPFFDFAVFIVDDFGNTYDLASVATVGDYGETGWNSFSWTATSSGTYEMIFAASNFLDDGVNSKLLVDNINVIPEPVSIALLGLGLVGIRFAKRK